ncbi:MAG: LolA [Devosia sp.]|nr:LolA [Devosia sp.]
MIRRDVLLYSLGLAFSSALPALALDRALVPEEEQLIRAIGEYNSAVRTMAGRFLQIDTQGGRTEGTFFIQRPDKVRFRYNPPSREEIISVGRGFYVINRKDQTQYAYPQDKIPLRQFLGDRIDFLQTNIVDVVTSDSYFSITIQDDTPAGTVRVSLIFDRATYDLAQWTLTEPSGEELTFSLYDVQKDIEIPKSYFYIDPTYKAVEPQV